MKAYIIYLPEREHSIQHSAYMLATLKSYGIDACLHKGTPGDKAVRLAAKEKKILYPYSIKNRVLDDTDLKKIIRPKVYKEFKDRYHYNIVERQLIGENHIGKFSRPGVVGCFYSHYALWKKCVDLNEPIMIFEDDVKFFREWHPVEFEGVLILSLGKSSFTEEPYKTYLENPTGTPRATPWRNFSLPGASGYAITPDTALNLIKFYKPYWYPADNAVNRLITNMYVHNYIMGRNTLPEEGNISMTKSKHWSQVLGTDIDEDDYKEFVITASTDPDAEVDQ